MKKAIVILGIILFSSFLITGCGGKKENEKSDASKENGKLATKKAKDIDVRDLKEPCDYIDALVIVGEEFNNLMEANKNLKSADDISTEDQTAMLELGIIAEEINKAFTDNKIDPNVSKNCDGVKKLKKIENKKNELLKLYQLKEAYN